MNEKLKTIIIIIFGILVVSYVLSSFFDSPSMAGNVAVVDIRGFISVDRGGGFRTDLSSSSDIVDLLDRIGKDSGVKAVIIDINSPGGTAVASDEIGQAIKKLDKPTIAVIREVGASGGYWIASSCDVIYANRMSITGSIGVIGSYLDFSELLEEYNVSYQRIVFGEYKDIGSPLKPLEDDERAILESLVGDIGEFFVEEVSRNRNLPLEKVRNLADGRVFLGSEALENGLVDYLGTYEDAKDYISNRYNITVREMIYQSERSVFSELLANYQGPISIDGLGFKI